MPPMTGASAGPNKASMSELSENSPSDSTYTRVIPTHGIRPVGWTVDVANRSSADCKHTRTTDTLKNTGGNECAHTMGQGHTDGRSDHDWHAREIDRSATIETRQRGPYYWSDTNCQNENGDGDVDDCLGRVQVFCNLRDGGKNDGSGES